MYLNMVLIIPHGLWSVLERKPAEHAKYCHCSEDYGDHLTGTATVITTSVGPIDSISFTCAEFYSCDPLQVVHSFCWHPSHLSGSAAHQADQACAVAFSKGTAVSCLPSSQSTANGNELICVSADCILSPEPYSFPFLFLFPRHPWCCPRVQVFVRLRLSELYTHTVLPKGNQEILAGLHQPGRGRCSSSDPKWEQGSCLEE